MTAARFMGVALLALGLATSGGCGDDSDSAGSQGDRTPGGGDTNPCSGDERRRAVGWDDETPVGKTPAQAFDAVAGQCSAPLRWDATAESDRDVTPRETTSQMHVQLELDERSAVLVLPPEGAPAERCPPRLEAEARVHLESDDGTLDEVGSTTLEYVGPAKDSIWGAAGLRTMRLQRDLAELGGALQVELFDKESGSLTFELEGAAENCAGSIQLTTTAVEGNTGSSTIGQVGGWSKNGCGLGGEAVALDEPGASGSSVLERIDALWGEIALEGTWDDGKPTTLRITTDVDTTSACRDPYGELSIPARVRYGTDDGRIMLHEARATVYEGTSEFALHLNLSDEMVCESEADTLPQTFHDCGEVESVTVQLSTYQQPSGELGVGDDGLNVYAIGRADNQDIPTRNLRF